MASDVTLSLNYYAAYSLVKSSKIKVFLDRKLNPKTLKLLKAKRHNTTREHDHIGGREHDGHVTSHAESSLAEATSRRGLVRHHGPRYRIRHRRSSSLPRSQPKQARVLHSRRQCVRLQRHGAWDRLQVRVHVPFAVLHFVLFYFYFSKDTIFRLYSLCSTITECTVASRTRNSRRSRARATRRFSKLFSYSKIQISG